MTPSLETPRHFVLDVDGVMSTGQFLYDTQGKRFKVFGPDDADALSFLKPFLQIHFVSADHRGFLITRKRIEEDMGYSLRNLNWKQRHTWIETELGFDKVIYMGDGIMDTPCLKDCTYAIAPANAHRYAVEQADFVTASRSGERAVADACIHILERYFTPLPKLIEKALHES